MSRGRSRNQLRRQIERGFFDYKDAKGKVNGPTRLKVQDMGTWLRSAPPGQAEAVGISPEVRRAEDIFRK